MKDIKLHRIFDANLNRAKEGLRVCEDVCRFILDERGLTRQLKNVRHELTAAIAKVKLAEIVQARNIEKDVGKGSIDLEMKRSDINDIFMANIQRVKESIRVLEEVSKLIDQTMSQDLKTIRYKIYAIEKKVITRF